MIGGAATWRSAEAARIAEVRERGSVPAECGPEIPEAPARGPFRLFAPTQIKPGSAGTLEPAGYRGPGEATPRKALVLLDVFDWMIADARDRHARRHAGLPSMPCFVPPFTPGQVQVARDYRWLHERHEAGGIRCASLEAQGGGGGGGGGNSGFIDAYVAEGIRLDRLRARIGTGVAMPVRRVRQSQRGGRSASLIRDRALVDAVCLGQMTLSQVLAAHGWAGCADHRERLRLALAAALDCMQGYRRQRPQDDA